MKRLAFVLAAFALAIQWPLWFGHGGWLRVRSLQQSLQRENAKNAALQAQNAALSAEIASLHEGSEAIEERARHDLHMIRPGETFFQFASPPPPGADGNVASPQPRTEELPVAVAPARRP